MVLKFRKIFEIVKLEDLVLNDANTGIQKPPSNYRGFKTSAPPNIGNLALPMNSSNKTILKLLILILILAAGRLDCNTFISIV